MDLVLSLLLFGVCCALASKVHDNTCTVYQGGCTYQVSLTGKDCMLRDGPANVLIPPPLPASNIDVSMERKLDELIKEDKNEIKKLEELERKLIKLMEGLSVRSLRHIRHIRNDLRQLSTSMTLLKQQTITTSNGKKKRGLTCPREFIGVGTWSSCYRFSTFNTTWHEAREYCNAFGADLVALDSLKESYILDYLIKSNPETMSRLAWWTAGNYVVMQRKWMWMMRYELRQMGVNRWAPGEPNARSTMHCLLMYRYADYRWTDAFCKDKHFFICEIELY